MSIVVQTGWVRPSGAFGVKLKLQGRCSKDLKEQSVLRLHLINRLGYLPDLSRLIIECTDTVISYAPMVSTFKLLHTA